MIARRQWTSPTVLAYASFALAIGAILRYPGGTPLTRDTLRYSLTQNFLSDLGMTAAWNGQPNRLGAALFVSSLLILIIGLGSALAKVIRRYASFPPARRWARFAGGFGLLASVAFAGVAMTPENRVMNLHVSFTIW